MRIQLSQGDCLELLSDIQDRAIDLILTDPPYGIDYQSSWVKDKSKRFPKILNDKKPFIDFIKHIDRILSQKGCAFIFTRWDVQQNFINELNANGLNPKNVIIWDKAVHGMGDLQRSFGSRYESIIFVSKLEFRFNGKRPTDIIQFNRVPASKLTHPNEKPVALLEYLITKCSHDNDIVLDCFMGSGSTGVACINTNRRFIGFELDEHYFSLAKERIENCKNQITK
ncbi:hypothetical protein BKK50_11795 [Rodentibacter rarus]|uniref:Methyltransferase n=2 Tax=Rodentibacter rarus TaxID=1908260 RepID=A0A1V3ID82_9PAST|nr:hypothetical protein BKK50_11795 [Rodentibacter rarus]